MATIENFEELEVWKIARRLTVKVYEFSRSGSFAKDYGFRDQICRASVSIVSNIAEGFERRSKSQFVQFLDIANGSAGEVRAQLYIALDLGYITQGQFQDAINEVTSIGKMLTSLIRHLRASKTQSDEAKNINRPTAQPPNYPTTQLPNHPTT